METITLKDHIEHVIQCIQQLQLSKNVFNRYKKHCEDIFLYCTENRLDSFSYQDAAGYCGMRCPSLKEYSVKETTKIAYTIADILKTGVSHGNQSLSHSIRSVGNMKA